MWGMTTSYSEDLLVVMCCSFLTSMRRVTRSVYSPTLSTGNDALMFHPPSTFPKKDKRTRGGGGCRLSSARRIGLMRTDKMRGRNQAYPILNHDLLISQQSLYRKHPLTLATFTVARLEDKSPWHLTKAMHKKSKTTSKCLLIRSVTGGNAKHTKQHRMWKFSRNTQHLARCNAP